MPENEHFGGTDAWAAIVPNLIGAVFGCAAARMFSVSIYYYPVFAIAFAFIIGVAKHCVFDNARLIDALAENFIIMLIFGIVCLIAGLFVN